MLLYDRILEHAVRMRARCGPDAFGETNCGVFNALQAAAVYEVSDVVPLFGDWERDREKAVPKSPPHPYTWAEWAYHDCPDDRPDVGDWWRLAALVGPLSPGLKDSLASGPCADSPPEGGGLTPREFFAVAGEDLYAVRMFKLLERSVPNPERPPDPRLATLSPGERGIGVPTCDFGVFLWSHNRDGTGVRRYKLATAPYPGEPKEEFLYRLSTFFLPVQMSFGVRYWQCADPWPAFMAFSFLHCRNIVTEEHVPEEKLQRRVRKAGNPPRVTYRTLHIEVPRTVPARQGYEPGDEEDAGPKVRFHLCSGHFRELRSEKFTAKKGQWAWVPAHWRGSKDLGEVHKTYRLESARFQHGETPRPR